ncbi:MAG: glucose-1-phosphate thymidylyltransferase [Candidatus ainarchaeum sp.]|nr:glucose-1-phosphate thymidylyltransferase [Candidatus ainarchaeum sp.]
MKALILSGGHGTRLRPLTHTSAKQLIPIANKPNLFYAIEDVVNAGVRDVGFIVGHTKEEVKAAVGDGSRWGIRATFIEQDAPRGLAHAVLIAEKFIGKEPFVMYLGDNILKGGINDFVRNFEESDAAASIMLCKVGEPQRFGVAEVDAHGRVLSLEEKPKKPKSDLALVGIYLFRHDIFGAAKKIKPSWRNELEITDAISYLVKHGKKVTTDVVRGWWKDTGKPEDILDANRLALEMIEPRIAGTVEEGVEMVGRVAIGAGTVVRKGSSIHGPAIIGAGCVIGPNAFIGPFTSIGDNSRLSNVEIENSVVIGDSAIECSRRIRDSLIGKNVHISSADSNVPKCTKLVLGEHSRISI